jgi:anti-anti-sigma factor
MKIKGSKNKIICEGNFIFDNADSVKEALLARLEKISPGKPVTIELEHVEEVDSSGLQLLLSLFKTLESRKLQYKVTNVADEMMEVLELSGLSKFFRLEV